MFQKGHDPRRRLWTPEEAARAGKKGWAALMERRPDLAFWLFLVIKKRCRERRNRA